jgi:2-phospho-L-lactate guanylyltransferase
MSTNPPGPLAAIPVKPFGVAKARLSGRLTADQRARLGKAVAARTAVMSRQAGADVVLVTGDDGVAEWAAALGFDVLAEGPVASLDAAARTAASAAAATRRRWVIVHADLPLATASDLRTVFAAAATSTVIVPSRDGGTNLLAGADPAFPFSYGTASFHRHLAAAPNARVVTHPRLAFDLDTPADLAYVRRARSGAWLAPFLPSS